MNCSYCTIELSDDALYCYRCGNSTSSSGARGGSGSGNGGDDDNLTLTTPPPIVIGEPIDSRYTIIKLLGKGGMGAVYLARRRLGGDVALKALHPEFARIPSMVARFRREARIAAKLDHENVVKIFEDNMDREGVLPYLVMELLKGETLRDILEGLKKTKEGVEKPLPHGLELWRAVRLMKEICWGVSAAHRFTDYDGSLNPIVHRDLKPENVMVLPARKIGGEESVKVVDFGIAKVRDIDQSEDAMIKTVKGAEMGSLPYMSPEQLDDKEVDVRSDVYSLGIMFYEMLAGRRPFNAKQKSSLMRQHFNNPPPPLPEGVVVPVEILGVALRALSKDPDDRPQDAQVLAEELQDAERDARERMRQEEERAKRLKAVEAAPTAEELLRAREAARRRVAEAVTLERRRAAEAAEAEEMGKRLEGKFVEAQKQFEEEALGIATATQQQLLSEAEENALREQQQKKADAVNDALKKQFDKKAAAAAGLRQELSKGKAGPQQFEGEVIALRKQLEREASTAAGALKARLEEHTDSEAKAFNGRLQKEADEAAANLKRRLENQAASAVEDLHKRYENEAAAATLQNSLEKRTADAYDELRKQLRAKAGNAAENLKTSLLGAALNVSAALRDKLEKAAADTSADLRRQLKKEAADAAEAVMRRKVAAAAAAAAAAAEAKRKRLKEEEDEKRREERRKRLLYLLKAFMGLTAVLLITGSVVGAGVWYYLHRVTDTHETNVNAETPPPTPRPSVKPTPASTVEQPPTPPKGQHSGQVNSIAISPDGKLLASAGDGNDKTVRLWDIKSGEEKFPGKLKYSNAVTSVVFSPNGKLLASSSLDGAVVLWDIENGKLTTLAEPSPLPGNRASEDKVFAVTFSPDGNTLAAGLTHGRVYMWDVNSGSKTTILGGGDSKLKVQRLAFSPDGETLVGTSDPELEDDDSSVSDQKIHRVILWRKTGEKRVMGLSNYFHYSVASLLFSPDGGTLYVGINEKIVLYDMKGDGCVCWLVSRYHEKVTSLALSPNGSEIVSARVDGTVELWDMLQNIPKGKTCDVSQSTLSKISQSPKMLAWNGEKVKVRSLAFTQDGKYVAGGLGDGEIRFWSVGDFK